MINYLTYKTYCYLQKNGILEQNSEFENDWLKYGIEITISSVVGFFAIILISAVTKSLIIGITFLAAFVPIRQFVGGYHADTYLRCNLTFTACYLLILFFNKYDTLSGTFHLVLSAAEFIIILLISPVKNRHKPIKSRIQYYRCKIIGASMFLIYNITGTILLFSDIEIGRTILYTLTLITVLGIIGFFKERRFCYEENS